MIVNRATQTKTKTSPEICQKNMFQLMYYIYRVWLQTKPYSFLHMNILVFYKPKRHFILN